MFEIQAAYYMVAATGVLIAAIFYILNLQVQQRNMRATLQAREAQLFNSLYQRFSTSEYCKQYITCMTMSWENYDDWRRKYPDEGYEAQQFYSLCNWYKTMNLLVEQKYVSAYDMGRLIGNDYFTFWEKFKPIVEEMRQHLGESILIDLDKLYEALSKEKLDIDVDHDGSRSYFLGKK
jgi:hypothetical protein